MVDGLVAIIKRKQRACLKSLIDKWDTQNKLTNMIYTLQHGSKVCLELEIIYVRASMIEDWETHNKNAGRGEELQLLVTQSILYTNGSSCLHSHMF